MFARAFLRTKNGMRLISRSACASQVSPSRTRLGLVDALRRGLGEAALAARPERLDQVMLEPEDLGLVHDVAQVVGAVETEHRRVTERKLRMCAGGDTTAHGTP